ncbi:hypothetical protein OSTOST_15385, partial [Ostertagia ostertagi]
MSILLVGAGTTVSVIILLISNQNKRVDLVNYSNLTIIYSLEGCLISILAVITCPISKALLTSLLSAKKKKAKVGTVPRQQLYCSIELRSRRKSGAPVQSSVQDAEVHSTPTPPPPQTLPPIEQSKLTLSKHQQLEVPIDN